MRRILIALFAAVSAIGFAGGTALADPGANVSFFHGADGTAHWAPQQGAIVLSETTTPGAYAGAMLMHVGPTAPVVAPNFAQMDTVTEAGGGSPRLVLLFGDGGTVYGYRFAMSTSQQSDPLHWDSTGGTSGFISNGDYSTEIADHTGGVVAAYVVTDSGWEGQSYTNLISNIKYGDNTYAG